MTLDEKIAVMQAAQRGERIQARNGDCFWCVANSQYWPNVPAWTDQSVPQTLRFNFDVYDYRVAPPKRSVLITTRKGNEYEVTANDDGSITFGCETVAKEDVDKIFALRNGGRQ